ncbi:MAG TPA: hypothetical protein VFN21_00095 [Acidimicrobiales bacterium]|nr:hypothetical protein [Acidimicrobiales bacterium]
MSGLLQIRGVSDPTRRALKARAAQRGQSLNSYLLELIDREAALPTIDEVLTRAASRSERSPVSSVDVIRADRETRDVELSSRPPR